MNEERKEIGERAVPLPVPVRGRFLKTLLSVVARKPKSDEAPDPMHSVGVTLDSIVATDGQMAVAVGEARGSYEATHREAALLESEREKIYGDFVHLQNIDRLAEEGSSVVAFPNVGQALSKLDGMREVVVLDVELLLSAARLAASAGAHFMTLLQPKADKKLLGFRFEYVPEDQGNLFGGVGMEPVKVRGVLVATARDEEAED